MSEPSWNDLYDLGKVTLQTRRPLAQVSEGDVYDAIISGAATMGTAVIAYAEQRFRSAFLYGAEGDDLTTVAHDRGVERITGSFAVGSIALTRPTAGAGAGTLTAGTRVATDPDETGAFQSYTLNTDAVFGALDLTKTVEATCTKIGTDGNILADTVTRFIDTVFDSTIVPSNPALFAAGSAAESDEELRDRTRGFFLTEARGTLAALEYGARQVDGVTRVTVEVDSATGIVTIYVADADGNSNAAMIAAVQLEIENWRDAGDVVNISGGVIVNQAVELSLSVRTGVIVATLLDRVRSAVVSAIGRLNPGETLYRDLITSAAKSVDPQGIVGVTLTVPATNIVPAVNELIRTNTGIVTFV